jgi:hypothetical protein
MSGEPSQFAYANRNRMPLRENPMSPLNSEKGANIAIVHDVYFAFNRALEA